MPTLPRPLGLPDFPWDQLAPYKELATSHPDGICDLSVGTPVDDTPAIAQYALREAVNAPGYPTVIGTVEVRESIRRWCVRRGMVDTGMNGVIPTIGSKEAVAWIPRLLGVGTGDTVLFPHCAYPTYNIGALLAGATPVPVDPTASETWPTAQLVWLNSPGNPDGHVLTVEQLRAVVAWARENDAVIISDECYAELPWAEPFISEGVPSLLDERVCDGDPSGLLVVYSLSKQSNLAGYRAAFLAGDPTLVGAIVEVRKHSGLMVPGPIQHALAVALDDHAHVEAQREVYAARRAQLLDAIAGTDLVNDPRSVAGLYLWLRKKNVVDAHGSFDGSGGDSWELVQRFAELGILVAPGDFYGEDARGAVRVALTASDERIAAAAKRLGEW